MANAHATWSDVNSRNGRGSGLRAVALLAPRRAGACCLRTPIPRLMSYGVTRCVLVHLRWRAGEHIMDMVHAMHSMAEVTRKVKVKSLIDSSVYYEKLPRDPRASLIVILYPNRHRLMIECGHSRRSETTWSRADPHELQ